MNRNNYECGYQFAEVEMENGMPMRSRRELDAQDDDWVNGYIDARMYAHMKQSEAHNESRTELSPAQHSI